MNYCKILIVCVLKLRNKCKIMTKEELIKFLKENLKVYISDTSGLYDENVCLTVDLYLGDECISSAYHCL